MSNASLIARARQLALVAENAVDQEAFRDLADALERAEQDARRYRELRLEVRVFAAAMEERLRANDYKGGWYGCSVKWLLKRAREELKELGRVRTASKVLGEAADVANFCMMIADAKGTERLADIDAAIEKEEKRG